MTSLLLYFEDQAAPALALAQAAGLRAAPVQSHRFPDGELRLTLPFDAHSADRPTRLVIYRSLHQPNEKLVELMLVATQARAWGVRHIMLVAPYLAYMRQDISFHPGEVVSQRQVGRMLAQWVDGLITVDPHLHRVARLGEAVPLTFALSLSAAPLLATHVGRVLGWEKGKGQAPASGTQPVLIGPDGESAPWIAAAAEVLGCPHGVCSKVRHGDHEVQIALPDLDVRDRAVVLLDDIASSGRTLAGAAQGLLARGAASVDVAVTHALFAQDALDVIRAAGVRHIWSTDAVQHESNAVPLAGLLAAALQPFLTPA
jgi:ribose-phosphate pyrophosphokinase